MSVNFSFEVYICINKEVLNVTFRIVFTVTFQAVEELIFVIIFE